MSQMQRDAMTRTRTRGPQQPPRFQFPRWPSVVIGLILLFLAVNGLVRMDISWARMADGPGNIWNFLTGAFPPNLERAPQPGRSDA